MPYYNYTADDVRSTAGQLAVQTFDLLSRLDQFRTWLSGTPDADLLAKGLTAAEVANIKSSYVSDMGDLLAVFQGSAATTQRDRRAFIRLLTGPATY